MRHEDKQAIGATMRYCLEHCDTDDERDLVLWVMDKLAEADQIEWRTVAQMQRARVS